VAEGAPGVGARSRTTRTAPGRERRVLTAVLDLLRDGGYRALTTSAVASRAAVSKETIYRTWPSKSELVVAALGLVLRPLEVPDLGSLESELGFLLEQRLGQYQQQDTGRVIASLMGACVEDDLLAEHFNEWAIRQRQINTQMFKRAIARGELDPDCPIDNLMTIMAAPMFFRLVWEGRVPGRDLLDAVVQCLLSMRAPQSGSARTTPQDL
jgi:AcrR family transcriptional regulator